MHNLFVGTKRVLHFLIAICDRDAPRNLMARTYLESQVFRALSILFANTFCGNNIFHKFVDTKRVL
jgi:hypothetical protein